MEASYNIKIQMPSKGKIKHKSAKMRKVLVNDLRDYLMHGGDSYLAKVELINSLIVEDAYELAAGDLEVLFSTVRTMIGDSIISNSFDCDMEECDGTVVFSLNLNKAKIHTLPSDYIKDHEFTFPVSGDVCHLCVLTVRKMEIIQDYLIQAKEDDCEFKNKDLSEGDLEFMAEHAAMFTDVVDIDTLDAKITHIREMDWNDFSLLVVYKETFLVGPDLLVKASCSECKINYHVKIKTDSKLLGVSLASLLSKYKFLVKADVTFSDFLQYTLPELNLITEDFAARSRSKNKKIIEITKKHQ